MLLAFDALHWLIANSPRHEPRRIFQSSGVVAERLRSALFVLCALFSGIIAAFSTLSSYQRQTHFSARSS